MRISLKYLKCFLLFTVFILLPQNSFSYDKEGNYVMGGNARCSWYISALSKAQLAGGLESVEGVEIISSYENYILGFQTGYNVSHKGKMDIFAKIGGISPVNKALFLIEDWCKKNPDKRFGMAVIAMAKNLDKY